MPDLDELLEEAARRPLRGWDVGYGGRIESTAPPWDFEAIANAWIARSPDLLDMGTGGGEWLSRRPFPKRRTVATEAWPPNVPIAHALLGPLDVSVVSVVGAPDNVEQGGATELPAMPFADCVFHLVTNRHESFVAAEVARVLAPGGRFVTQQVGGDLGAPFRALLGEPAPPAGPPWTLSAAVDQLHASGLEITLWGEGQSQLTFADVGALAWYLRHLPWVMPEFDIGRCRGALSALHGRGPITVPQPMFWLAARKPTDG
jgi:SAM-dependent methyltransferase